MDNPHKPDRARLVREYVEAVEAYKRLVDEFFKVDTVRPGHELERARKVLTLSDLGALEDAKAREDEAHRRWREAITGQ